MTRTIEAATPGQLQELLGVHDMHLKMITDAIPVRIVSRGGKLLLTGEPVDVELASAVIEQMQDRTRINQAIDPEEVRRIIDEILAPKFHEPSSPSQEIVSENKPEELPETPKPEQPESQENLSETQTAQSKDIYLESHQKEQPIHDEAPKEKQATVPESGKQKTVEKEKAGNTEGIGSLANAIKQQATGDAQEAETLEEKVDTPKEKASHAIKIKTCAPMSKQPRSRGQARYLQAIEENDLIFCAGPAGSGKTYLAVAMALHCLQKEAVRKIVLVRPAVEAGEKLGFLPGDMQAKVNPFLRPLLDALHDMIDYEQVQRFIEHDVIEIVPLAFMRGRTLNDTFMILDEAQNTTITQMKMFLTRMGTGSKVLVTGDETQHDLPAHVTSGFTDAMKRLKGIHKATSVRLDGRDIVRHPLVRDIVKAYDQQGVHKA